MSEQQHQALATPPNRSKRMTREEYREVYLRSDHWLQMRAGALERAEHRCQVCNSGDRLDVHHRTYERLGEERPADLTVLCRRCHELFHHGCIVKRQKPRKQVGVPVAHLRPNWSLMTPEEQQHLRTRILAHLAKRGATSAKSMAFELELRSQIVGSCCSNLQSLKQVRRYRKRWEITSAGMKALGM